MATDIWSMKYRPKTFDDYVWRDPSMREKAEEWVAAGALPHLLFTGNPGSGKTSLAWLLVERLGIPSGDILYVNASRERKIEDIQDKIGGFSNTWALGETGVKYVILDECLAEDEKIRMVDGSFKSLKDLEDFVPHAIQSYNMSAGQVEDDEAYVVSRREADVYGVELEDGRTIETTIEHPFLVMAGYQKVTERRLRDLKEGDDVVVIDNQCCFWAGFETKKIRNIVPLGKKNVVNLCVTVNHTFINEHGIPTHNCDGISPPAQKILRADIETYSDITRVIATANYRNKIIPALHSRFQEFQFQTLSTDDFTVRLVEILSKENVEFDYETIMAFVKASYPDLRKCINMAQQNTIGGKLVLPNDGEGSTGDYLLTVMSLFKDNKFQQARKLIVEQASVEEYPEVYRFLYRNLNLFGETQDQQDDALLIIRNGLYKHSLVFDPEINLSATLVELTRNTQPNLGI